MLNAQKHGCKEHQVAFRESVITAAWANSSMYMAHVRMSAGSSGGSQNACEWQGLTGSPPGQV